MKKKSLLIFLFFLSYVLHSQSEHFDLAYLPTEEISEDTLQRLNLFLPEKKNAPLLVWIGGGAWSYVNRSMETDLGRIFAKDGIALAAVGHRLSAAVWHNPEQSHGVQHPKHIEDIAASIKWLVDHASQYGYDKDNIFVGGFSSGAHLAALIGMDSRYLNVVGLGLDDIRGLIPISGTYDITNYHEAFASGSRPLLAVQHVESVFGSSSDDWVAASPVTYLDSLRAPMLLISDNRLGHYTQIFQDTLHTIHYQAVDVYYVGSLDHGPLWRDIGMNADSKYRRMIVEFINENKSE